MRWKIMTKNELAALTLENIRRTSMLNENSTPEDFAKEYDSAFDRIYKELIRLDKQKN